LLDYLIYTVIYFSEKIVNICSQVGSQLKPIDYDTLMIEVVVGINANGRVYELGLDGSMHTRGSTAKSNKYSNYTDIAHSMSEEVDARLRQTIVEQQQTINSSSYS